MKKEFKNITGNEKMNFAAEHVFCKSEDEFLKYDVCTDCVDPETDEPLIRKDDSILTRFYAFRNNKIDYDADASLEANIVYERVFNSIINRLDEKKIRKQCDYGGRYNKYGLKYELGEPECKGGLSYRGDTMNSVAMLNRQYYWKHKELHSNATGKEFPWPVEALRLINTYHTMGNFMILPFRENFSINQVRGQGMTKDYFDLYLLAVYNYYMVEAGQEPVYDVCLEHVLGYNRKLKWFFKFYLSMFIEEDAWYPENHGQLVDDIEDNYILRSQILPGWQSFVEKNLFQDFVSPNEYGQHGMPKELWSGHFSKYNTYTCGPKREEQFFEFWTNAADRIEKRSRRIFEKLHSENKN